MRTDTKTDSNQALLKPIVGIVVGLVKKQKQESPKTLGLQRVVYFLQCRLNSLYEPVTFAKCGIKCGIFQKPITDSH